MKFGDLIWGLLLVGITALLVIPSTHAVFITLTKAHPYGMAFGKFLVLATMGELLAIRILAGKWSWPAGTLWKGVVWGIIGILIALMFVVFSGGIGAAVAAKLLPGGTSWFMTSLVWAFMIAAVMNYSFAPAFMAAHRISDVWIDARFRDRQPLGVGEIISRVDWGTFIKFVVGKTVPYFWIPAHTITFILPPEYRVLMAAYLGIALGVILAYGRRKAPAPAQAAVA